MRNIVHLQKALRLYFIMGSQNCDKDPEDVLRKAIAGGITIFQYREKGSGALTGEDKFVLGKKLRAICRAHNIPFIVNDDAELALALDADGVHIGPEDEAIERVREKVGDKIIGVSAYSLEEAKDAVNRGADYLGVGLIFPTQTKPDAEDVHGVRIIKEIRAAGLMIPMVGIGGINATNANEVVCAGADGVAVVSAIARADVIVEAARDLLVAVSGAKGKS